MKNEVVFDGIARVLTTPVSRGRALKYLAVAVAGAFLAPMAVKGGDVRCPTRDSNGPCARCGSFNTGTPCDDGPRRGRCMATGGGCCHCVVRP
jgi:hypothetical protein